MQALRICQKKIEQHGVKRMRLVATEACRRAKNAREFMKQVRRETGLQVEIIAAEEEARRRDEAADAKRKAAEEANGHAQGTSGAGVAWFVDDGVDVGG